VEARLNEVPKTAPAASAPKHEGQAKVDAITKDAITLSHGPIPSIKWGAMTMDFKSLPPKDLPRNLAPGDRIDFEFYIDAEGLPQLTRVSPAASPSTTTPAASGSKK
jgi:Cu(I)/Ag(I) efflux system membrane fusion protein